MFAVCQSYKRYLKAVLGSSTGKRVNSYFPMTYLEYAAAFASRELPVMWRVVTAGLKIVMQL